jgi:hypothetical protein
MFTVVQFFIVMRKLKALTYFIIFSLCSLLPLSPVSAASANVSKSFQSNQTIPNGSLVSLVSGSSYVQLANTSNSENLSGVSLSRNDSLLAVNPSLDRVQVATSGVVNVLVSNVNGDIKAGDDIAVSPFNGVGMKSSSGDRIIGTSLTSFNSTTQGALRETVTNTEGQKNTLEVGYVKIDISIGVMIKPTSNSPLVSLQQFVEGITGKPISIARLLIGLVITFIAIVTIITLTYASIYGGIVSIGRNPLAKFAVFRTMSSVLLMVLAIALVATFIVYLLLL